MPLAVEHEVVVLMTWCPTSGSSWSSSPTSSWAFGFGMALGLMEVSLAERLVRGAHGPGELIRQT